MTSHEQLQRTDMHFIRNSVRRHLEGATPERCARFTNLSWSFRKLLPRKPHGLPAPLVVSLTSYPPRFKSLSLTLKSILLQTVRPTEVVLWIAHGDAEHLPPDVLSLRRHGLCISFCAELRSYKKIIPTLQAYPDSFVVTADDDLFYWPSWLEELTDSYVEGKREVLSHRVHEIRLDQDDRPLPYASWSFEVPPGRPASPLNFSTGMGGVMYPPGSLHPDVSNEARFMTLAPQGDDIWLYWMVRLNGWIARRVGTVRRYTTWEDTQDVALFHQNLELGENDQQIRNLVACYGFPRL